MVMPTESNLKEETQSLIISPLILDLYTIETTIEEETTISKVEIQEEDLQIVMPDKIAEQSTQINHNAKSAENLVTELSTPAIDLIKISNLLAPTIRLQCLLCLPPLLQCLLTLYGILIQEPQTTLHQILKI